MSRNSLSTYDSAMLSDEGDLYSDDDDGSFNGEIRTNSLGEKIIPSAADRRAHHNALERKRRDHIKDSFTSLRDSVPSLQGEKVTASRAQILKKAAEYIQFMRKKNTNVQTDIDEIAKQNKMMEEQIRRMEKGGKHGGDGGGMTNQALSSLFSASEPTDVSTSYDISENSNASSNSGLGSSSVVISGGGGASPATSAVSAVSIISSADNSNNNHHHIATTNNNNIGKTSSATVLNGTVSMRPVTVKNGTTTSKIIVQNPQHKSTPHVIHVTTTPGAGSVVGNGVGSNISAMSSNGTPIIISTSLSSPSSSVAMGASNGTNNGYVINKGGGAISLANGFRTLVVQQPSATSTTAGAPSAVTTTPNIHILGTIPASSAANYSKQPPMKKLKISTDNNNPDSIISSGGSNGAGVTSVS